MRVLVVGGGGREHAIAWKLSQSPLVTALFCAPGNAGTADCAKNVEIGTNDLGALAVWAVNQEIDLTVVGPEAPLAAGIVDIFSEHGLRIFGPTKDAARLESSKRFAKEIMADAAVNSPEAEVFTDFESAEKYVQERGAPIVIKADGLAAGKGVTVSQTVEEAVQALRDVMLTKRFGESGAHVLVEDFIDGEEASVMAIVDGDVVLPLAVSQDHKRLGEGDSGPNTGGMAAFSPTPVLGDISLEELVESIFIPVVRQLRTRGIVYRGFLYAGVIVDKNERRVSVLEFNCRLGDPETQPLMMRLSSDLLPVLDAAVSGRLGAVDLCWHPEAAACVVAASRGYPGEVDDGKVISGLFAGRDDCQVFQAGTVKKEGQDTVYTKGGRILAVTALGPDVSAALDKVYEGLSQLSFDGIYYRKDIGGYRVQQSSGAGSEESGSA